MNTAIRFHIVSTLLAAALLSAPAQAQWMRTSDQLGFYAGASVATAKAKNFCSDAVGTFAMAVTNCDEKDSSWKVSAGYQFHRNLAVEVGYVDLGKYSVGGTLAGIPTSAGVKPKAFEFLAVGILPLTSQLSAYVKLGGYRWDADASASGALVTTGKDKGTDFTYGVGVMYDFTRNLGVRAEAQRYVDTDITTIGGGVVWHFR